MRSVTTGFVFCMACMLDCGLLGAVPAVMLGGLGTVAIALLWMKLLAKLRRINLLDAHCSDAARNARQLR